MARPGAEHAGPLEVGPLADRQRLAPDQQRGARPRGDADDDDDVEQRPAEHGGHHDGQRQERDHQEPLDEPVEDRARPAAEVARHQPDQGAEHHRDQRGGEPDEQGDPGAPDQQGQHRPALVVGAERKLPGRRLEDPSGRLGHLETLGRRDDRGEDGDQREGRQDRQPQHPGPVGAEDRPAALPRRASPATRQRAGRDAFGGRRTGVMSGPAGRGGRRPGWRPGWPGSRRRTRPGRCPGAPSSPAPTAPRSPAGRDPGSRRPSPR